MINQPITHQQLIAASYLDRVLQRPAAAIMSTSQRKGAVAAVCCSNLKSNQHRRRYNSVGHRLVTELENQIKYHSV